MSQSETKISQDTAKDKKTFSAKFLPTILFSLATLSLASFELLRAFNNHYSKPELVFIFAFSLWVLIVGIIDIQFKNIPLWMTSPVIILSLALHSIFPVVDSKLSLIGFQMSLFDVAMGIAFGFIMIDVVTHFGNWLAKYPKSSQGLLPLCVFVPVSVIAFFLLPSTLPYWSLPVAVILLRLIFGVLYSRSVAFKETFEKLLQAPLVIYSIFFVLIFVQACAVLYNKVDAPNIKINYVVLTLCSAFVLEEVILPVFNWLSSKFLGFQKKEEQLVSVLPKEEEPSVLGGGDASLTAALGALWGAIIVNNCLLLAFLLAFVLVAFYKLIVFALQKNNSKLPDIFQIKEIPFAPFITISAQVILLAEILVKTPGASSCGV